MRHLLPLLGAFLQTLQCTEAAQCYSCASTNMQSNRGPQRRIQEPRVYDNYCNVDVWILRERGVVQCTGPCFKWQQILNNSGANSYMTFRGCYNQMFDITQSFSPPNHTFCTQSQASRNRAKVCFRYHYNVSRTPRCRSLRVGVTVTSVILLSPSMFLSSSF